MKVVHISNILKYRYQFPTKWEDLSMKQILLLNKLVTLHKIDPVYAVQMILIALGLPYRFTLNKKVKKQVQNIVELPGEWLHTLLHEDYLLGWMMKPNGLTNYPLKKFTYKLKTYHGPARFLLDLKAIELVSAYSCFYFYSKTQKDHYLCKMIAILYRPSRTWWRLERMKDTFDRDIRQKLNAWHWDLRSKDFEKLDAGIKNTILRMFSSEWDEFEKKYPLVFSKSGEGKYDPDLWIKLLIQMSGQAFGTLEETKMTNADEVFKSIQMKMEESLKMKDALKK